MLAQKTSGIGADIMEVDDLANTLHSGPNLEEEGVESPTKSQDEELKSVSNEMGKSVDAVKLQLKKMTDKKL